MRVNVCNAGDIDVDEDLGREVENPSPMRSLNTYQCQVLPLFIATGLVSSSLAVDMRLQKKLGQRVTLFLPSLSSGTNVVVPSRIVYDESRVSRPIQY